jgi:hypothetical protein
LGRYGRYANDPTPVGCRAGGTISIASNNSTASALGRESEIDNLFVGNWNRVIGTRTLNVITVSSPTQLFIQTAAPGLDGRTECVKCQLATLRYLSCDDQATYFGHSRGEPAIRFDEALSWYRPETRHGSHDLKVGFQYNYLGQHEILHDGENGIFTFSGNTPFNRANPATYPELLIIRSGPNATYEKVQNVAAYVQDKWQWTEDLTVNLGLRYDVMLAPVPTQNNPLFSGRSAYPHNFGDVGPRLGFAYSTSNRRSVVRVVATASSTRHLT